MRFDEMIRLGWISADFTRAAGNQIAYIQNVCITPSGHVALNELRRDSARSNSNGGTLPKSLEEKREMQAQFMRLLYDEVNGSPLAMISANELGSKLGWDEGATELVTEYLDGEGLLTFVVMGGVISITHAGVVEVEAALLAPTEPTLHFPPVNQINIGTATNVSLQQGTTGSTQNVTIVSHEQHAALLSLLGEVDSLLGSWPQDDPIRAEAEAAVGIARSELASGTEVGRIRTALSSVAAVITKGAVLGTSADVLFTLIQKLLKAA